MKHSESQSRNIWYVRRDTVIEGPYTTGVIQQYIILGRILLTDELSQDRLAWVLVSEYTDIVPDVVKSHMDGSDHSDKDLESAKRWADERNGEDRREKSSSTEFDSRRKKERRKVESENKILRRKKREATFKVIYPKKPKYLARLLSIAILFAGGFWLTIVVQPEKVIDEIDCASEPSGKINWRYCHKEGVVLNGISINDSDLSNIYLSASKLTNAVILDSNLSYSDFSSSSLNGAVFRGSVLVGANFANADLSNSDLSGTDMSYSDLQGADLSGANLENARLESVIWTDGRMCQKQSITHCL